MRKILKLVRLCFSDAFITFLSDNGGLYAIMPISIIYSEKDKQAWDYLKNIIMLVF